MAERGCNWRRSSGARTWRRVRTSAAITSDRLRKLRDYWLSARGARVMPVRADLDPADIPTLLPYIALIDVFHAPLRFRYRLIGTALTELTRRDATGRWLDETLYGADLERILFDFRESAGQAIPVAQREVARFQPYDWLIVESLLLPLGAPDGSVAMLLAGVDTVPDCPDAPDRDTIEHLDWTR